MNNYNRRIWFFIKFSLMRILLLLFITSVRRDDVYVKNGMFIDVGNALACAYFVCSWGGGVH